MKMKTFIICFILCFSLVGCGKKNKIEKGSNSIEIVLLDQETDINAESDIKTNQNNKVEEYNVFTSPMTQDEIKEAGSRRVNKALDKFEVSLEKYAKATEALRNGPSVPGLEGINSIIFSYADVAISGGRISIEEIRRELNERNAITLEAMRMAVIYTKSYHMSYAGLIEQLLYDGYPEEEVLFVVNNCCTDFMQQAVDLAVAYTNMGPMGFSYSGLKKSLIEGDLFTEEQAQYGVDNCGADWKEQAAKSADTWSKALNTYDRNVIIDCLIKDGFTNEEVEFGVKSIGL